MLLVLFLGSKSPLGMSTKCVKCRFSDRISGDTWCVGCGAWEAIGVELTSNWAGPPGLRAVANNLVLGAAREIRALRALGAGLGRASLARGAETRPAPEAVKGEAGQSRATPGLAAKSLPKPPKVESEESEVYTYETDSEEEEAPQKKEKPGSATDKKQDVPLPRVKEEKTEDRKRDKKEEHRRERSKEKKHREEKQPKREERKRKKKASEEDPSDAEEKKKRGKKTKRAGRKHKRLNRLAANPYQEIHQRLPDRYFQERAPLEGAKEKKSR